MGKRLGRALAAAGFLGISAGCAGTKGSESIRAERVSEAPPLSAPRPPLQIAGTLDPVDPTEGLDALEGALRLEALGLLDQAVRLLGDELRRGPADAELLAARGRMLERLGYERAAEVDLAKACRVDPTRPDTWARLGRVRMLLDRPGHAAEAFEKALFLGWSAPGARLELARALRRNGDYFGAAACYQRVLSEGEAASPELLVEAASLVTVAPEASSVDYRRALEQVDRAIEVDPGFAQAWFVRGLLLESRDFGEDPLAAYERAVEENPRCLEAWTNVALLRLRRDDGEGARSAARHALELELDSDRRELLRQLVAERDP